MEKKEFPKSRIISTKQLVDVIRKGQKNSERFCFILGSGASVESGIPTGNKLECEWMKDIEKQQGLDDAEEVAKELKTEGKLHFNFSEIREKWEEEKKKEKPYLPSEYYFDIFKICFHPNKRNGYYYLENLMEKVEPSFGYWPLVEMLTDGKGNNLVVTTNFDSLVEDALFIYKNVKPLVVNHELLAGYAGNMNLKRPIVAKLHRDVFFDPLNDMEDTEELKGEWKKVLSYIFNSFTPIVIGYGGGDHSLMDMLKDDSVVMRNGIYWCYMEENGLPGEEIQKMVTAKEGCFVCTAGFDATMLAIGMGVYQDKVVDLTSVEEKLKNQVTDRIHKVDETIERFESKINMLKGTNVEYKSIKELINNVQTFKEKRNDSVEERIAKNETTARDYYWKGREEYDKKNYSEALKYYELAIDADKDYVHAYNSRAILLGEMKEYKKALEDYSRAIELDENYVYAYNNRGSVYREQGEYEKAIQDYNRAIELDENYVDAYNGRGNVYYDQGECEKAIQDYNRAIELDENYVYAYNGRGNVYNVQREYEKAIQDYNRAIKLDSKFAYTYNGRGNVYYNQGEYEKALDDYNKALELDSKYVSAYKNRARLYRKLGKISEAEADEKMAESLKQSNNKK